MKLYYQLLALVVIIASSCSLHSASAHSTHAPLLKRAIYPRTVALEILPRRPHIIPDLTTLNRRSPPPHPHILRFDDSFRLTISAFDEVFHLHLRPNDHLIHPAARIHYYGLNSDGAQTLLRTVPLLRENVKAYLGEVIAPYHSPTRMREDTAGVVPEPHPADLGWARIVVHRQGDSLHSHPVYEGAFSANGVIYHIATKENYLRKKHALDANVEMLDDHDGDDTLVIWRDSDVMTPEEEHFVKTGLKSKGPITPPASCAHDTLPYNTDPELNPVLRRPAPDASWLVHLLEPSPNRTLYRRQDDAPTGNSGMGTNFASFIGQKVGCPTTQKVVFMGVAADCEYVTKAGGQESATSQILTTWNTASALYKSTINISLGITELKVQAPTCPSSAGEFPWNVPCSSASLDERLSLFSAWRGGVGEDNNGLWHLMSGCPSGSEVGIAWLGTLCQSTSGGAAGRVVSGTAVSTSGRTEWQVVAHEIGHNFGAIHDCAEGCAADNSKCCPLTPDTCDAGARFIMSPVAQSGEKVFSPCSVGNICILMQGISSGRTDTSCLVDPGSGRSTISLQMCGNGIVETGEDCDPGLGITSACCDANCKFKANAVCDPDSSSCCTDQCTFAPATKVCRPSKDSQCDQQETCTGNSSSCPTDVFSPNGKSCGEGELACASGICTSVAQQCRTVGASMNLTEGCSDRSQNTCQIVCKDPRRPNTCIQLNSMLVEGSPCGLGGTCIEGNCKSGSVINTIKSWYTSNLQIAIPVTIVAGLIVLLILWGLISCIRRACAGRRSKASVPLALNPAIGMAQHRRLNSSDGLGPNDGPYRSAPSAPRSQYTRVPPLVAHDRTRSGQSADLGYNYNANNRANWVDDRAYNGAGR